jgi:hypothetical protein
MSTAFPSSVAFVTVSMNSVRFVAQDLARIRIRSTYYMDPILMIRKKSKFKGNVQPFELGGETRLIRSDVKY